MNGLGWVAGQIRTSTNDISFQFGGLGCGMVEDYHAIPDLKIVASHKISGTFVAKNGMARDAAFPRIVLHEDATDVFS